MYMIFFAYLDVYVPYVYAWCPLEVKRGHPSDPLELE